MCRLYLNQVKNYQVMVLWTWLLKFLSGFIPTTGERVGKILWVGLISFFVLLSVRWVDNRTKKPENDFGGSTIGTVINNPTQKPDSFFFGCAAKGWYLGGGKR